MTDEWQLLRRKLQFVAVTDEAVSSVMLRDSTDAPFVAVQRETNAIAILTNDKDILESSAPSAGRDALKHAALFQNALLISVGATAALGFVALLPFILIGGVLWLILKGARRSPGVALLAFVGIALLVWAFWDKIKAAFKRIWSPENKDAAIEVLGAWTAMEVESRKKSEEAKRLLESTLGGHGRICFLRSLF